MSTLNKMNDKKHARAQRDDPEQSRLFIEKAREIEADERGSAADKLLDVLGHRTPEPRPKKKARRKGRAS